MDSIKINVDCNKKDYFSYYLSRITTGVFKKIRLVLFLPFLILLIFAMFMVIGLDELTIETKLFSVFILAFFFLILFLFFIINYITYRRHYFLNPLSKSLWFMAESKIQISNNMASHSLLWDEIYKILEFRSCFVVHTATVLYYIIPKRCFNSQEQMDSFINLINSIVQKKKRKLKNYKFKSETILSKAEDTSSFNTIIEKEEGDCLFELNYRLSKKEYLKLFFGNYYSKPTNIIFTILGVLVLYMYFKTIEQNIIFLHIFGLIFTILIPLYFLILVQIAAKKGPPAQYKFYDNYILSTDTSHTLCVNLADMTNSKETKTDFYIKNKIYFIMIPKRIFENQPDNLEKLRSIIRQHIKA